jgi:hypothetical protein
VPGVLSFRVRGKVALSVDCALESLGEEVAYSSCFLERLSKMHGIVAKSNILRLDPAVDSVERCSSCTLGGRLMRASASGKRILGFLMLNFGLSGKWKRDLSGKLNFGLSGR